MHIYRTDSVRAFARVIRHPSLTLRCGTALLAIASVTNGTFASTMVSPTAAIVAPSTQAAISTLVVQLRSNPGFAAQLIRAEAGALGLSGSPDRIDALVARVQAMLASNASEAELASLFAVESGSASEAGAKESADVAPAGSAGGGGGIGGLGGLLTFAIPAVVAGTIVATTHGRSGGLGNPATNRNVNPVLESIGIDTDGDGAGPGRTGDPDGNPNDGGGTGGGAGGGTGGGAPPPNTNLFANTTLTFNATTAANIQASNEYREVTNTVARNALGADTSDATGGKNPYDRAKVNVAYGYGLTGNGVNVGIVDAGFNLVGGNPAHQEFDGTGKVTVLTSTAPLASNDHGAHVSGLAVAERDNVGMQGIAYNAKLFLGMSPQDPAGFKALFDEYTQNGVKVSSNSYGMPVNGNEASPWRPVNTIDNTMEITARAALAYKTANSLTTSQMMANISGGTAAEWDDAILSIGAFQAAGGIVVWANSNYGPNHIANGAKGLTDVDLGAALPLAYPQLSGGWITVVNGTSAGVARQIFGDDWVTAATKKENNIVLLSAACGQAARFCLTMDGGAVNSASNTGIASYTTQTGTSQATPQVAGMLALLREAFPTASAADLAARLLYTADNSFFATAPTASTVTTVSYTNTNGTISHQVSDIWGHGFPDLQRALAPVGATTVRTLSGAIVPLASVTGTVQVGSAVGAPSLGNTRVLFNDTLNGVFSTKLNAVVTRSADRRVAGMIGSTLLDEVMGEADDGKSLTVRFAMHGVPDETGRSMRQGSLFSLTKRLTPSLSATVGLGFTPDHVLGFAPRNAGLRSASFSDTQMGIAYFNLGSPRNQRWVGSSWNSGAIRSSFAAFSGGANGRDLRNAGLISRGRTSGFVFDTVIGNEQAPLRINASMGQMREKDGYLGTVSPDMRLGGSGTSRFMRAGFQAKLPGRFGLQGNYVVGWTNVRATGSMGLISDYSRLRATAASMAVTADDVLTRDGRLTVSLSRPLRVEQGRASLNLPQGIIINGPGDYQYTYVRNGVSLVAEGRETDVGIEYTGRIAPRTKLRLLGLVMTQPGNVRSAKAALGGLISLRSAF